MDRLIDCDLLEYCLIPESERKEGFEDYPYVRKKPVYSLPVFEMCRAFHLLFKYRNMSPAVFRKCWNEFSETCWGDWFHVSEYPRENLPLEIWRLKRSFNKNERDIIPCEGWTESYWDGRDDQDDRGDRDHFFLTLRLRELCRKEKTNIWQINEPVPVKNPKLDDLSSKDLVMDTNNLLDMLNKLPEGNKNKKKPNFSKRLSRKAIRRFNEIIKSEGLAGTFIVPISALEEAERVSRKKAPKYNQARKVIQAIKIQPEGPFRNILSFEPLTMKVFDCLYHLYEKLESVYADNRNSVPSLGDTLVIAHGIYNRCPVASNEWFEKSDWDVVAHEFPFLVLKD